MGVKCEVLVGIDYIPDGGDAEVRHEPGDVVDDVPADVMESWLADGTLRKMKVKTDSATPRKSAAAKAGA